MGEEENKATVRMFYDEVLNRRNLGVIDKVTAENYVDHTAAPGLPPGREGEKLWFQMLHAAFPDGRTTIDDIIAEGDKVVVRGTMTGTHSAEFMGIPATGKQVKISGLAVTRFREGQSVGHWGQWDVAGLMQQLGVMPPPPGAPESECSAAVIRQARGRDACFAVPRHGLLWPRDVPSAWSSRPSRSIRSSGRRRRSSARRK